MKKEITTTPEMKLAGLSVRTNNKDEMNPEIAKIGNLVGEYFNENIAGKIPNRKNTDGLTIAAYTDYESNEHGNYTYFIGEEITSFENIPPVLQAITIPAGKYQKLSTPPGQMPQVVINAWQEIWKMSPKDLGGKRRYQTDFEIYDERAADPENTIVDIYIGIE